MKAPIIIILVMAAGCSRGPSADETTTEHRAAPPPAEAGPPPAEATVEEPPPSSATPPRSPEQEQHITALMERLNSWCESYPEECEVYANPDAHPGRAASGETGGWIADVTGDLAEAGVEVVFNQRTSRYERRDASSSP